MQFVLAVPPGLTDPAHTAQWMVDVESAYEQLQDQLAKPPRGAFKDKLSEHDALFAMMRRWDEFNPADADYRHILIGKLQVLGYRLEEPVARSSKSGARTYMRVLRADGVNAGFFNSSTFTFVRARIALPASDLVRDTGRYPSVDINSEAAVEFVARVATQFCSMP